MFGIYDIGLLYKCTKHPYIDKHGVPLERDSIWHDSAYINAVTETEYKRSFRPKKDTPYLALTREHRPGYNGTAIYCVYKGRDDRRNPYACNHHSLLTEHKLKYQIP